MVIKNKIKLFAFFPKRKKAWVRILEAFFSIILIMGILLIVISKDSPHEEYSKEIYIQTKAILQDIELNKSLRANILDATPLPINWENFELKGLTDIKNKIIQRTPNYLNCSAKLCEIEDDCGFDYSVMTNVYTNVIGIYATNLKYAPRKLKLFCWEK